MAALSGTRRSRKKSVVKPRRSSHATRVHGKKMLKPRPIPREEVAEKKELVKRKGVMPQEQEPYHPEAQLPEESPVAPEQPMPDWDEFFGGEKGKKKRRERIKKNPRKNWKELGLLEKRGLA